MSRAALACAVCLLVAGCAAPTASGVATDGDRTATLEDDRETETPSVADETVAVDGGPLPADPDAVFARVRAVLAVDASPPVIVVVRPPEAIRNDTGDPGASREDAATRSFPGVVGISGNGSGDGGVSVAAYAPGPNSVVLNERIVESGPDTAFERTLAHEFVHVVQFQRGAPERVRRGIAPDGAYTRDRSLTYAAVLEGAAVFAAAAYDRRYLNGEQTTVAARSRYSDAPAGAKYAIAPYYFGVRYLRYRLDDPGDLPSVYDDPPRTTEQLLHNDTDGSERPRALAVSTDLSGDLTAGRRDTNGELFVRIALGTELNRSRAVDAAAGWGTDRLVAIRGENRNFAWATRWDSPAEADEFAAALEAYLDSRATRSDGLWRDGALAFSVARPAEETVVLLAGDQAVVRALGVEGTNASVSVSTDRTDHRGAAAATQAARSGTTKVTSRPTTRTTNPMATSLVE